MMSQDAVSLTKTLLRFDTISPPGRERDCARYAGAMLQEWGYTPEIATTDRGRTAEITLVDCRFLALARENPAVVCGVQR